MKAEASRQIPHNLAARRKFALLYIVQGVSQLLKQSDWAQIQDFKWYHNDDYIYWKVKR